jgi:hypothetical protein
MKKPSHIAQRFGGDIEVYQAASEGSTAMLRTLRRSGLRYWSTFN